jgi:hypothetical protein
MTPKSLPNPTWTHHHFSRVRIHTDRRAAESARAIGARAYTVGSDIYFGQGEYRPGTREGRRLIAHELAHVAQQRGTATSVGRSIGAPDSPAEREAASVADRVAGGGVAPPIRKAVPAGTIQRQVDDTPADADPAPTPVEPWSSKHLLIVVESDRFPGRESCSGFESPEGISQRMGACGPLRHFCSTPVDYSFRFLYWIDSRNAPYPSPNLRPQVSARLAFVPAGASSPANTASGSDPKPGYPRPGDILEPSFGKTLTIRTTRSGTITLEADIVDASSGARASYRDSIGCVLDPCT